MRMAQQLGTPQTRRQATTLYCSSVRLRRGGDLACAKQQTNKPFGLRGEDPAFSQHNTISPFRKKLTGRDHFETLRSCNADADDNGDAHSQFDVFFNDLPAAYLHSHLVGKPGFFEGAV